MPHADESRSDFPLEERGEVVTPDGRQLEGWVEDADPCPGCGTLRVYAVVFDAFACLRCNRWLEVACEDPDCDYCHRRPSTPLPC